MPTIRRPLRQLRRSVGGRVTGTTPGRYGTISIADRRGGFDVSKGDPFTRGLIDLGVYSKARPKAKRPKAKVPAKRPSGGRNVGQDPVLEPRPAPTAGQIGYGNTPAMSGGTGGYNVESDPAIAAIRGASAKMRAAAQATAQAKRKQAAVEYGDPTGVTGLDEATAKAARENPFSIVAANKRQYEQGVRELEDQLNKANLFYGGYRGQQLGEAGTAYQQQQSDAANRYRAFNTDIESQLAEALMNADLMDAQALLGSDQGYYDPGYYDWPTDVFTEEQAQEPGAARRPTPTRRTVIPPSLRITPAKKRAATQPAALGRLAAASRAKVQSYRPPPRPKPKPRPAPRRRR